MHRQKATADGRSRGRRRRALDRLQMQCGWRAHARSRRSYDCRRNRRSPEPGASHAGSSRNGAAISASLSVSQWRLPRRNTKISSGSCSTGTSLASGSMGSGKPLSSMMASDVIVSSPAGAMNLRTVLPKAIEISSGRNRGNRPRRDFVAQLLRTLAARVEEANHQGWLRAIEGQFIAVLYEHDLDSEICACRRGTLGARRVHVLVPEKAAEDGPPQHFNERLTKRFQATPDRRPVSLKTGKR
jgi:hypothetical protein